MSYRPCTDFWFLTRAKLKDGLTYYGAYLGGFPERARVMIGAALPDPVLHVCGGMARAYPYARGFGPNDQTLDMDPATESDFLQDARNPLPTMPTGTLLGCTMTDSWAGMIIDPPYSEIDAEKYVPGAKAYPAPSLLVNNALRALPIGRKVGIIHYQVPRYDKTLGKFVACVGVACGHGNRIRAFSVFERI